MLLNCQSKLNALEEAPPESEVDQLASHDSLTMPDAPLGAENLVPTASLAFLPSCISAPPTPIPTTSGTAQPLGTLTQTPSRIFPTASGELVRFTQEEDKWRAVVPAFLQAYTCLLYTSDAADD